MAPSDQKIAADITKTVITAWLGKGTGNSVTIGTEVAAIFTSDLWRCAGGGSATQTPPPAGSATQTPP